MKNKLIVMVLFLFSSNLYTLQQSLALNKKAVTPSNVNELGLIEFENAIQLNECCDVKTNTISVTKKDKQLYVKYAYSVLDSEFDRGSDYSEEIPHIGNYDKLFISLIHKNKLRGCKSGRSDNKRSLRTKLDITEAVIRSIGDNRFGGFLTREEIDDTEIVLNILFNKRNIRGGLINLEKEIELGIHAIQITKGKKNAYFKESVPITKNYSVKKTFERLCKKAKLIKDCYNDPKTKIYIFDTLSFKGNRDGKITDLYRYNILFDVAAIEKEMLLDRIKLTKVWFLNNINSQTKRLEYQYAPSSNKYSSRNNHIRQLATLWSITELKDFLKDSAFNTLIRSTLDYYLDKKMCLEDYCFIKIENESKIAYNAFLILSLLNMPSYPESKNWIYLFANGIISLQNENGSYNTYFRSKKNTGIDYYPGEAMLALMNLYQKTGDKSFLNSVKRAFNYYKEYWRSNKNTAFIPWHTQTYLLLYNEIKNPEIIEFIFEMNDWLIDNYQIKDSIYPDKIGGFPKVKPRYSTSTYIEGINDAYFLAKIVKDQYHIRKYKEAIRIGIRFILLTQYTKDNSFYVKNSKRSIGGFKRSLTSNRQRIDYTQHALRSIIKTYTNDIFKE
jgi:AMMECR1 domain-containing protein